MPTEKKDNIFLEIAKLVIQKNSMFFLGTTVALTSPQNSSTTFLVAETTPTTLLSRSKTPPPRYMTKSGTSDLRVNPNARSRLEDANAKAWD